MKQLKALAQKMDTAQELIKSRIFKKYPVIQDIRIYNATNIALESEHFNIDLYEGRSYTEQNVRMSCKMEMSEIPTEAQAVASVKAMKLERKKFMTAMNYVIDKVLNDCIKDEV